MLACAHRRSRQISLKRGILRKPVFSGDARGSKTDIIEAIDDTSIDHQYRSEVTRSLIKALVLGKYTAVDKHMIMKYSVAHKY